MRCLYDKCDETRALHRLPNSVYIMFDFEFHRANHKFGVCGAGVRKPGRPVGSKNRPKEVLLAEKARKEETGP